MDVFTGSTFMIVEERQQASAVFKGKKGQKVREQVVKRSRPLPEDERVEAAKMMRGEDARKIQVY